MKPDIVRAGLKLAPKGGGMILSALYWIIAPKEEL